MTHTGEAARRPFGTAAADTPTVNSPPVLDIFASDLSQPAATCQELRDDGERLRRIDRLPRPPEVMLSTSIRVVPAATLVAVVPLARMPGKGIGHGVCLEDVHLVAAVTLALRVAVAVAHAGPARVELVRVLAPVSGHL